MQPMNASFHKPIQTQSKQMQRMFQMPLYPSLLNVASLTITNN